jgi:hypothetical protein
VEKNSQVPSVVWLGSRAVPPESYLVALARVTQDMQASSVNPNNIKLYAPTYTFCGIGQTQTTNCDSSNSNITICRSVQLQNTSQLTGLGAQACGVAISFQYPYQFWLPFTSLNSQQINLTADVQMVDQY